MPDAPLRPCATPDCRQLVPRGHCPAHRRVREQTRGTAHQRGYTAYWHQMFRPRFLGLLVEAGIAPVCGAALPAGPQTRHSRCRAAGLLTGTDLHLHHEPPLAEWERRDRSRVCDPCRIQLLCASCHRSVGDGRSFEHDDLMRDRYETAAD